MFKTLDLNIFSLNLSSKYFTDRNIDIRSIDIADKTSNKKLKNHQASKKIVTLGKSFFIKSIDYLPLLNIKELRELNITHIRVLLNFSGKALIRFGLFREGYSFCWISEKLIEEKTLTHQEILIDITDFDSGTFEFQMQVIEESQIELLDDIQVKYEKEIDAVKILQNKLGPDFETCSEIELFFKFPNPSLGFYSYQNKQISLLKNGIVDLFTYFNSFSYKKWNTYTNVNELKFYIKFKGKISGTVEYDFLIDSSEKKLTTKKFQFEIESSGHEICVFDFVELYLNPDVIGVSIEAIEDSDIYDFGYFTDEKQTQVVKLGIGITTFKREKDCVQACKRLTNGIENHPYYKNKIALTVVDNGQTIKKEDIPEFVNLIPNRNLGGSGGFMRNLIHYKDEGSFSHCIFMDDDASCFPESIFRTYQFLAHAIKKNVAISGAMFSANIKFLQWECGAWFNKHCHPLHCQYDMRQREFLSLNELEDCKEKRYGAWWYFAFPIAEVKHYVWPFFVRGDDVQFSYINDFTIVSINGMCSWQEDFTLKEGPMTFYLDIRSHIMHHILLPHLDHKSKTIIKFLYKIFFKNFSIAYFYDRAKAINLAMKHVMQGPKYWEDNLETVELRKMIKQLSTTESPKEPIYDLNSIPYADHNLKTRFFSKFFKKYSLNGHLLPNFMLNKKLWKISKYEAVNPNKMYLRKNIVVFNPINKTQYLLTKNSCTYFRVLFNFIWLSFIFTLKAKRLRKVYLQYFKKEFVTDSKWKEFFKNQ
jgi:hypothetical protein